MRPIRLSAMTLVLGMMSGACTPGGERFTEIDRRYAEAAENRQARIDATKDNAMLSDLSMAGIHFVPHTDELNSLGQGRLQRFAELLRDRGGTLYLDTASSDEAMNRARLQSMSNFLASAGISKSRIGTQMGMPAGPGIRAVEAIQVKERAFKPEQDELTNLVGGGGGFGAGGR